MMEIFIKKLMNNERGSALTMALIATIGLGTMIYYSVNARRNTVRIATKNTAEKQIDQVVQLIGTLLVSPASCNANFENKPLSGSLTTIYKCNGNNNCRPSGPNKVPVVYLNTFDVFGDGTAGKIQLIAANYTVQDATPAPSKLFLTLQFKKDVGKIGGASKLDNTMNTKTYVLEATVIIRIFDHAHNSWAPPVGAGPPPKIIGCALNINSLNPY